MSGQVPNGKITEFNKEWYLKLIGFVDGADQSLNLTLRRPTGDVALDGTLGSGIQPGSQSWKVVASFVTKSTTFGGSVATICEALDTSWVQCVQDFKDGVDAFQDTSDLAKMKASDFPTQGGHGGGSTAT